MGKDKKNNLSKPSKEEAIEAVRTLIRWAGDDPSREGLIDTPKRVVNSYTEFFLRLCSRSRNCTFSDIF